MKLFTTAAALYYLGSDYRYNTFLMATGPIRDGVLEGDLVVYGTGDPTFSGRFGSAARGLAGVRGLAAGAGRARDPGRHRGRRLVLRGAGRG
jgi:D-alanyl-D-alanine carboxypeptidase